MQRSGDAHGDCLIGCPLPNSSIEQCRVVVIVTGYTLIVTSQYVVIFRFATNVLAKFVDTTCIFNDAGGAVRAVGGAVKQFRAMETYKKNKKIIAYHACFCSSAMLTSKIIITEIIENHSDISGCSKSCNDYISSGS